MNVASAVLASCIDAFCSTSIGRSLCNLFALALSMVINAFGGDLGNLLAKVVNVGTLGDFLSVMVNMIAYFIV
ncbi:MAG TPA: hypothetical protein HA341_02255 [Halobacteria archaeon]|jgi:hypothetical protein|nr:hypothetical protein [Halobacteria archaeon]